MDREINYSFCIKIRVDYSIQSIPNRSFPHQSGLRPFPPPPLQFPSKPMIAPLPPHPTPHPSFPQSLPIPAPARFPFLQTTTRNNLFSLYPSLSSVRICTLGTLSEMALGPKQRIKVLQHTDSAVFHSCYSLVPAKHGLVAHDDD